MKLRLITFRTIGKGIAHTLFITLLIASFSVPARAAEPGEEQKVVDDALVTFKSFMADKEMVWMQKNLKKAKALVIFPSVARAGFILGGSGGTGVLIVKNEKTGKWSQPVFFNVSSISLGIQAGVNSAEVVMMLMSKKAIGALDNSSFKLGGEASIAVGPSGSEDKGNIPEDIVYFARAKGLYVGLNLEGSNMEVSAENNKSYYKKDVKAADILNNKVSNKGSAALRTAVRKAAK